MNPSKTFNNKFNSAFSRVCKIDYYKNAKILGLIKKRDSLIFDFFNRQITFSRDGIHDIEGQPVTDSVKYALCQYLLMCPDSVIETSNKLVTLRDFSNSGPLYSIFTSNTGKIIQTTFSGNQKSLENRSILLGGKIIENISYDLSFRFTALSRIPVVLNFNDQDDMMPANASFLFHNNADKFLDLECLTILCTYLTGQLIQQTV